jgi:hypothetical protein
VAVAVKCSCISTSTRGILEKFLFLRRSTRNTGCLNGIRSCEERYVQSEYVFMKEEKCAYEGGEIFLLRHTVGIEVDEKHQDSEVAIGSRTEVEKRLE